LDEADLLQLVVERLEFAAATTRSTPTTSPPVDASPPVHASDLPAEFEPAIPTAELAAVTATLNTIRACGEHRDDLLVGHRGLCAHKIGSGSGRRWASAKFT
jgi:hypothetical protein